MDKFGTNRCKVPEKGKRMPPGQPISKIDTAKIVEIQLAAEQGILIIDADDYSIDDEFGWLHLLKDGEIRGSMLLSRVLAVFIKG